MYWLRHWSLLLFFFSSFLAWGQKSVNEIQQYPIDRLTCRSNFKTTKFEQKITPTVIRNHLLQNIENLKSSTLVLDTIIESKGGFHFSYHQEHQGVKIFMSQVKVNTDKKSSILSILDYTFSTQKISNSIFPDMNVVQKFLPKIPQLLVQEPVYFFNGVDMVPSLKVSYSQNGDDAQMDVLDRNGTSIYHKDLNQYSFPIDTIADGTIFNPDPLTSAQVAYGPPYADGNDNDFMELNDQRDTVTFDAKYETTTGQFVLQNNFVNIQEHSSPTQAPATSSDGHFYFSRSEPGFEDVNAFYHITTFQEYIQSLGFHNVASYRINVDTHGQGGQDQSFYSPFFTPPRISFGEGGVDDAEDADVIIHEYGHAIVHSAVGSTLSSGETGALNEGTGDYFAASYSRSISDFKWEEIFNWDGHNDFWDGRYAVSTDHYPEDLQNNLYADADIWSSTIMEIWDKIGKNKTDELIIESLFSFSNGMTMKDAAQLFFQADQTLNNGIYKGPICNRFLARGLFDNCVTSINSTIAKENFEMKLFNSAEFTSNKSNAYVRFNHDTEGHVYIYNISGKLKTNFEFKGNSVSISPNEFESGIFLMTISTPQLTQSFKLIKY